VRDASKTSIPDSSLACKADLKSPDATVCQRNDAEPQNHAAIRHRLPAIVRTPAIAQGAKGLCAHQHQVVELGQKHTSRMAMAGAFKASHVFPELWHGMGSEFHSLRNADSNPSIGAVGKGSVRAPAMSMTLKQCGPTDP
jgi:hypothetical protein